MAKKSLTTFLSLIATIVAVMLLAGISVFADEVTYPVTGDCGTNLTWTLDADGNFIISGTGEMDKYENYPWSSYSNNIKTVTVDQGITSIAEGAFSSLSNLTKATLADSVTSIGRAGFAGSSKLNEINLPDTITEIGAYSFTGTALKNVTLPSNLNKVTSNLFSGCRSLESVYIPDGVTDMEGSIFAGSSIKNVRLPADLTYIPEDMFANSDLETIELPSTLKEIGRAAFFYCHLTKITIPEGVEIIDDFAFSDCDRLKTVVLPSTLKKINFCAFGSTSSLEDITIPGSVEFIESNAFNESGIKVLSFNEGSERFVTTIADSAFSSCTRLKTIELSSSIGDISNDAFSMCTAIDTIIIDFSIEIFTERFDSFLRQIVSGNNQIVCYVPGNDAEYYRLRYPFDNVTFKGNLEDVGIGDVLSGYSLSLEGDIGVKFYLRFNDVDSLSNDAKMLFTISSIDGQKSRTSEVYVKPQSDSGRSVATTDGDYYVFKCLVNAKEMTSIITAQIVDGENKGSAYTYTVQDYAKFILDRPSKFEKEQNLIKTMLNYGCACQVYFDYNLDNPANRILSTDDQDYGFLNSSDINAGPRPEDLTIEGTDIKIAKASLVLNTTSVIKLFITGADENTVFKYGDEILTPVKSGEYYIVRIEGVSAQDIVMLFTLRVYDGNNLLGTLSYSPLYYFKIVLDNEIDPNGPITYNLKVLVSMMYKYGDAALKYHPLSAN